MYKAIYFNQFINLTIYISNFAHMSVRLYIGNLSFHATGEDLHEIFSNCGDVEEAIIVTRSGTNRSRGFGFVSMKDASGADEAIRQLDGQELAGRAMSVNIAKERQQDQEL